MQKQKPHLEALLSLLQKEGKITSEEDMVRMKAVLQELPEETLKYLHGLYLEQGMKVLQQSIQKGNQQ